jgi:hypothetical protein
MITFYMVSGLIRGTIYQFAVSASNYVGQSANTTALGLQAA